MKVEIIRPSGGTFVEGSLKGISSEQDAPGAHIVIEIDVVGTSDPAKVTLDEVDLSTIVRLATASTIQRIRDAVR
jgi:hypothetical protein